MKRMVWGATYEEKIPERRTKVLGGIRKTDELSARWCPNNPNIGRNQRLDNWTGRQSCQVGVENRR